MQRNHSVQLHDEVARLQREMFELRRQKTSPSPQPKKSTHEHFIFQLNEDMGVPSASAEILKMDQSKTVASDTQVMNTLNDFSHLITGDQGVCFKDNKGVYWAIHPEDNSGGGGEPTPATYFELTADLSRAEFSTATAIVVVSSDPALNPNDPITVANFGRHRAFTGARGWASRQSSAWWIVNVNEPAIHSEITLAQSTHLWAAGTGGSVGDQRPLDAAAISLHLTRSEYPNSWIPTAIINPSPTEPPGSITNPENIIGHDTERALVIWNQQTEHFELTALLQPINERLRCYLKSGYPQTGLTTLPSNIPFAAIDFVEPAEGHRTGDVQIPAAGVQDPLNLTLNLRGSSWFIAERTKTPGQTWYVVEVQSGPEHFFSFELKADVTGNPAIVNADIYDATDQITKVISDVSLYLNHQMFSDMKTGDIGICEFSHGRFFGVNAPCVEENPPTTTPNPGLFPDPP